MKLTRLAKKQYPFRLGTPRQSSAYERHFAEG